MSCNASRMCLNSRPTSPVYLHVVKDTPIHVCVDRSDDVDEQRFREGARSSSKIRRPKKPGVNVPTSKLMGRKKTLENKRVRSMSPPWVPPPGKSTRGSKSPLGPFWNEEEAELGQQDRYVTQIQGLMGEVEDLRDQLERERTREDGSRVPEDGGHEFKQNMDLEEKEKDSVDKVYGAGLTNDEDQEGGDDQEMVRVLIETELSAGRCHHQMQHVFDSVRNMLTEGHKITARDMERLGAFFHDCESRLYEFKTWSNELRALLKLFQQRELMGRHSLLLDNSFLEQKRQELQEKNQELQYEVKDKDLVIEDLRRQLAKKSDETINFASTHESLENVKGHLQQQLKQKSGDCNRMAVQIRTLESELTKERLDKEHLMDLVRNGKDRSGDDRDSLKKAARAQKQRAQKAEETVRELSTLVEEKDRMLDQMKMDSKDARDQLDQMHRIVEENEMLHEKISYSSQDHVIASLNKENDNLRSIADQCESRLKDVEREMENLRRNIGEEESGEDGNLEKLSLLIQKLETSEKNNQTSQIRIEELERKIKNSETQILELKNSIQQKETSVTDNRCKADDLVRENAALMRQLEAALMDSRRNADNAREKISSKDRSLQSRINEVESQLAQQRTETLKWRRNCEEMDRKHGSKSQDLKVQLEQAEATNRSMHTYVQFLKKSYANVFGDMPLANGLTGAGGTVPPHLGGPICF